MNRFVRIAAPLVAVALTLVAPKKAAGDPIDAGDADVPYEVDGAGYVTSMTDRTFTIGEVTFELPASLARLARRSELEQNDEDPAMDFVFERFGVGDWIDAGGTLRADGTVLAFWAAHEDAPDPYDDSYTTLYASGIVESVDGDPFHPDGAFIGEAPFTFVVNGKTYRYDTSAADLSSSHDSFDATDPIDGSDIPVALIEPGDTVFIGYQLDDDGVRGTIYVYSRMSGSDTVVSGTITDVWNDGSEFAIDGVHAVCDGNTALEFRDPADTDDPSDPDSAGDEFPGLTIGQIVEGTGVLRSGVVFLDKLVVVREPGSPGAKRLAKRAGKLRAHGVIEETRADGTVVVSGLAVKTRGRVARSVTKSALAGPRRVDVAATLKGGVALASAIRRR